VPRANADSTRITAAAIELARALVLLEPIIATATDVADEGCNGYKLDAQERRELREVLGRFDVWSSGNPQLLEWARRVGHPRRHPALATPRANGEPGRW
jgi:hypothetical protein